jgi:hypothetical protein
MTYSVLDLVETLAKEQERIRAHLSGFNLSIDFDKLKHADRLYVRETLQKAICKLEFDEDSGTAESD